MAAGNGSNGDHVIDIIIETADHTGPGMQRAADRLLAFDRRVQQTQERVRRLTNRAHRITLDLIDRVTPRGTRINSMLRGLADRAWRIPLQLNDRITARLRDTEQRLFRLTARAYTVTVNLKDNVTKGLKGITDDALSSLTGFSGGMLAGAGIGYGIYDTVQTHKAFEAQMSTVGAISGATAEQLDQLTAKAREMGSTSVFSATEAGKAFEYMAMAGWKTEQMVAGIKPLLDLAAAGGTELGQTSDIITDAMSAFKMDATTENVQLFADTVAKAATSANTDVGKMGYTFQYLATSAGALGYSIQDTALAIDLVADMGIKGEKAGTGLLAVLNGLSSPSKEAAEAMDQYGISLNDGTGKAKPFRQTMLELREVFKQLNPLEQQQLANTLAGVDGMKNLLAIVGASDERFNELANGIDHASDSIEENGRVYQGWAAMVAEKRTDNLEGDLKALSSAWEEFQHSLMTGAPSNILREFVQGVKSDIEKLNGYMKDGLDFSDIGRLAIDVIVQLKNKFLELDGVGSVLAGGALIGGIAKITSKAMKLVDVLRTAETISGAGGSGGSDAGGGPTSVNSMTVQARSVAVYGSNGASGNGPIPPAGGGGGEGSPRRNGNPPPGGPDGRPGGGPNPPPAGGSRMARFGRMFGRIATPLMLAAGAYEAYNTSQENDTRTAAAQERVDAANARIEELNNSGLAGASSADLGDAVKEKMAAINNQQTVEKENTDRMGASVGALVGGTVGGVAGTFLGGPIGAMVGGVAGGAIGEMIGSNVSEIKEKALGLWEDIKTGASDAATAIGSTFSEIGAIVGEKLTPITDAAITGINFIVGAAALIGEGISEAIAPIAGWFDETVWTPIQEGASAAWDSLNEMAGSAAESIGEAWSEFSAWLDTTVWQPVANLAGAAWGAVAGYAGEAWSGISSFFAPAASWFDSTVWQPISSAAGTVQSAITSAFESAWSTVTGIWSAAGSWFESNVIAPVKAAFDKITSIGSSITGLRTSGSTEKDAAGTIAYTPRKAIIGEAGPEAIIPLGAGRRNRAIDLWEKVGSYFGIGESGQENSESVLSSIQADSERITGSQKFPEFSLGTGKEGQEDANVISISAPPAEKASGGNVKQDFKIDIGGMNLTVEVNGGESGEINQDAIVNAIRENFTKLADEVAGHIAEKVGDIWENQPVSTAI